MAVLAEARWESALTHFAEQDPERQRVGRALPSGESAAQQSPGRLLALGACAAFPRAEGTRP